MTFELTIHGESPAELLAALTQLGGTTNILNTQAPQPQSEPVPQPDKPKAQTPAKQKKAAQKPAPAPEKQTPPENDRTADTASGECANPTMPAPPHGNGSSAPDAGADGSAASSSAPEKDGGHSAPTASTTSDDGPLTADKIRKRIMELMQKGKQPECQKIIKATGATSISTLPPESYTAVWAQLEKLKDEVGQNAAD